MKRRTSNYHISAAAIGFLVLGFSLVSPQALFTTTQDYVASAIVGLTVGVLPNDENTLATQLQNKETELAQREAALQEKESAKGTTSQLTFILALFSVGMSLALFILVGINFYLDLKRRGVSLVGLSVDLRSQ